MPSVPKGQAYKLGSKEYLKTEKEGIKELGNVGFVLVAGGLGERLGYSSGIKVRRCFCCCMNERFDGGHDMGFAFVCCCCCCFWLIYC